MLLSKCAVCSSKKSRFIKEQEAKGILSNLGLKAPLNKIPLLGDIFFKNGIPLNSCYQYKMNEIVNKFLLTGDKCMPEMHLKQPGFTTYSACGPFTKNKERIEKFMQTGNKIIFTKMILIKLVFHMIWLMANIKI